MLLFLLLAYHCFSLWLILQILPLSNSPLVVLLYKGHKAEFASKNRVVCQWTKSKHLFRWTCWWGFLQVRYFKPSSKPSYECVTKPVLIPSASSFSEEVEGVKNSTICWNGAVDLSACPWLICSEELPPSTCCLNSWDAFPTPTSCSSNNWLQSDLGWIGPQECCFCSSTDHLLTCYITTDDLKNRQTFWGICLFASLPTVWWKKSIQLLNLSVDVWNESQEGVRPSLSGSQRSQPVSLKANLLVLFGKPRRSFKNEVFPSQDTNLPGCPDK